MNRDLTRLCLEDETFDTDEVTDVEEFLKDLVVHVLVLVGADVVTGDIHLDSALAILQLYEASLAHDTAAHHTAGDDDLLLLPLLEVVLDVYRKGIGGKLSCRIRVDTHVAQLLQALASSNLLLA